MGQEQFREDSPQRSGQRLGSSGTYYQWLDIPSTATAEEVRKAYRLKSKLYHPDTTALNPETAVQKFRELNEAYAVLGNPEQRSRYNLWLSSTGDRFIPPSEKAMAAGVRTKSAGVYTGPQERPLSPGELFALFLLGFTFVACLVLALILGIARGEMVLTALPVALEKASIPQPNLPPTLSQTTAQPASPQSVANTPMAQKSMAGTSMEKKSMVSKSAVSKSASTKSLPPKSMPPNSFPPNSTPMKALTTLPQKDSGIIKKRQTFLARPETQSKDSSRAVLGSPKAG
ncbi:MAG: DnaJ domain-containing protein [Thermosynechococcaceae cyanobacterium MS004]|nr:DnaJ domain-containing protein [Thermosynechococcaceae cyanobacterium MS004]